MLRILKIPVARRSSVSRAKPFLIASRGVLFLISLPWRRMVPVSLVMTPNRFSNTSVRPEPSSPAMPRTLALAQLEGGLLQPGIFAGEALYLQDHIARDIVLGGKRLVSSRPTISRMISSMVSWLAGRVATHWPSRMMVTSSLMRTISSILWEM